MFYQMFPRGAACRTDPAGLLGTGKVPRPCSPCLGKLYLRGKGVGKDPTLGVGFITKACEGGESGACDVLGQLYEAGNGVEQNLTRAATLYSDACTAGTGVGCYHLGKLYPRVTNRWFHLCFFRYIA